MFTEKCERGKKGKPDPTLEESLCWTVLKITVEIFKLKFLQYGASITSNESYKYLIL
jgi:hypothetical protein